MENSKKKEIMADPRTDTSSSSRSVADTLPSPIVMEILSRLPIRTLMASRCVCKSWLLLTSETEFAELHSTRAPTELLLPVEHWFSIDLALGEFETRHSSVSRVHFNFIFKLPRFSVGPDNDVNFGETYSVYFVNSCRGFLCCCGSFNRFAVIWNPITDQFIAVPAPRVKFPVCTYYAFGFSPKANRFKLLRMVCANDPVAGWTSSEDFAEVFTFEKGTFSWRIVDYCLNLHPDTMAQVFVECAIHWVIEAPNPFYIAIVSFDFDSEQFKNVPLPPHLRVFDIHQVKIGVLGGCLSLTDFSSSWIDVWVMKEYGVQGSWTKLFSIEKVSCYSESQYEFELITYLENGEILMLRRNGLMVAYDPAEKRFRSIGRAPSRDFKTIAYSPSLFWLEDPMMENYAYGLDVKLRPALKVCRSLIIYDRTDSKKGWRLNEESSAEHLAPQERSEALSLKKKKPSSEAIRTVGEGLANHCKDEMCAPAMREEGQERLNRMGLVQSPVSMEHNAIEALREELRKKCEKQKELEERFQQTKSRIEQLKEQIKANSAAQIAERDEEMTFDELLSL